MTYANQAVVKIVKGKSEGSATQQSFEKVWEPRGWKIKEDKPKRKRGALTPTDNSSEVSDNNEQKEEAHND